jgi:adenosine deaminase
MSIESYLEAIPKVELNIRLEGAVSSDVTLLIAEQNEVAEGLKHFNTWAGLVQKPDYDRADEIIKVASQWPRLPEDLSRMAYNVGTALSKQNVRYAEVTVNPALYSELQIPLEQFFAALNDGRDRAERAWGVRMSWILAIPREEPRRADDIVRYALTAAGRKANVVAIGLVGKESSQPVGQFERAFANAEKKGVPQTAAAGEMEGAEGIQKTIEILNPTRIDIGWGAASSPEVLSLLQVSETPVVVSLTRALKTHKIASYKEYPLRKLYDEGVKVVLSSDMPAFYGTNLNEQFRIAAKDLDFAVEELEELALNAVRGSFLPEDEKAALLEAFQQEYAALRAEHLEAQAG